MKKTLTILIIALGFSFNSFTQTKQNDATWEETIEFLKENLHYATSYKPFKMTYEINSKELIKTSHFTQSPKSFETFKLERLFLTKTSDKYNSLGSLGYTLNLINVNKNGGNIRMFIKDYSMYNRINKAFMQLAFYAKLKREKSRF
ncbi:MAG: hypothetical protein COA67_05680 [Lutibacter sp.]|nr:MAG: hypothetical protein COA67_05680 [Lutibacter sp.]